MVCFIQPSMRCPMRRFDELTTTRKPPTKPHKTSEKKQKIAAVPGSGFSFPSEINAGDGFPF
jgi:hypothetical protein